MNTIAVIKADLPGKSVNVLIIKGRKMEQAEAETINNFNEFIDYIYKNKLHFSYDDWAGLFVQFASQMVEECKADCEGKITQAVINEREACAEIADNYAEIADEYTKQARHKDNQEAEDHFLEVQIGYQQLARKIRERGEVK